MADGLRSSIASGHYKSGDKLPNLHEIAAALNVSEIVTRRAVQLLTKEGLLNPRRGTGIAVCGTDAKTWRGHVLFIHWSGVEMHYHNVLSGVMVEQLHTANVLVSTLHVSVVDGANSFAKVRAELGHAISLAVIEGPAAELAPMLVERNIPFIQISQTSDFAPQAVRKLSVRHEAVLGAIRDHCLACGVRTVLQVAPVQGPALDIGPTLTADGLTVDTLRTMSVPGMDYPEAVERGALRAMEHWLAARPKLPDLLWFSDDFVARGALLALSLRGIRVPDDVQVISWANKGHGPVFIKPLTRVEMDPKAHGALVTQCILEQLTGQPNGSAPVELAPTFIAGETTRGPRIEQ